MSMSASSEDVEKHSCASQLAAEVTSFVEVRSTWVIAER